MYVPLLNSNQPSQSAGSVGSAGLSMAEPQLKQHLPAAKDPDLSSAHTGLSPGNLIYQKSADYGRQLCNYDVILEGSVKVG